MLCNGSQPQYHAGAAFAALRRCLPWDAPHVRELLERCMDAEQQGTRAQQPQQGDGSGGGGADPWEARRDAWLHGVACEATPAAASIDNDLSADAALSGGRVVVYAHHTVLVIGGSGGGGALWTYVGVCAASGGGGGLGDGGGGALSSYSDAGRVGGSALEAALRSTGQPGSHPALLPDCSRLHAARGLWPLRGPVRLLRVPGEQRVRLVPTEVMLPPLEGVACCAYGGCVLLHGGVSPSGEATGEMRALVMRPDPGRPGEYAPERRVIVHQEPRGGSGGGAAAGASGGSGQAWWQHVGGIAAGGVNADASTRTAAARGVWDAPVSATAPAATVGGSGSGGGAAANAVSEGGTQHDAGASQPCAPPSARYGHHMAVERGCGLVPSARPRLLLFGGRKGALLSCLDGGDAEPADAVPCVFWAELPPAGGGATSDGGGNAVAIDGDATTQRDWLGEHWPDATAFPYGNVVVDRVEWWRLPLRPARLPGSHFAGSRCPALPDPLRTAAIAAHDGFLFVLSSSPCGAGTGAHGRAGGAAAKAQWLLHRIDLSTGSCEILHNPQSPQPKSSSTGGATNACATGAGTQPPPYHEESIAVADDTLPYIYVYGSREAGSGAAALAGGCFTPSLHRLDLRAAAGGGGACGKGTDGDGPASGGGIVRWEAVPLAGAARWHAVREPAVAASGGCVALVGGVRDSRSGAEARVQLAVPAMAGKGASATASAAHPDDAALARCRRVIAERLRRVAPREVAFATPSGGGRRPVAALLAALALYSQSGLFDDSFEEALDEADGCSGAGGGCGGGSAGLTLPGHDPLAVAAAAAWVMGLTPVKPSWDIAFLDQLLRVAHLWALLPLQRECVRLLARLSPALPPQQLPAALALWGDVRRLSLLEGSGSDGARVQRRLLQQLQIAASASRTVVHLDNVTEVMAAARQAATAAGCGDGSSGDHLVAELQHVCVRVAEEQLEGGGTGGAGPGDAAAGRSVTLFACRFDLRPLLFRAMRWWRRRLASGGARDGAVLAELAELLRQLRELDAEQERQGQQASRAKAHEVFGPSPAKRQRTGDSVATPTCGDASKVSAASGGAAALGGGNGKACCASDADRPAQPAGSGAGAAASQAAQLGCFLWGELLRSVRPNSALTVLQAFAASTVSGKAHAGKHGHKAPKGSCEEPSAAYDMPGHVRQELFRKLAVLPAAQRLALPPSFLTPGHREHGWLEEAAKGRADVAVCGGIGDVGPAAHVSHSRGGQQLAEAYGQWQREQEAGRRPP